MLLLLLLAKVALNAPERVSCSDELLPVLKTLLAEEAPPQLLLPLLRALVAVVAVVAGANKEEKDADFKRGTGNWWDTNSEVEEGEVEGEMVCCCCACACCGSWLRKNEGARI